MGPRISRAISRSIGECWCGRSIRLWLARPEPPSSRESSRRSRRSAIRFIPAVHYADLDGDFHFVVLEHPEGETLDQRIRQRPLPSNEIHRLGVQVLRTLEVAHAAGIAQTARYARPRGFLGRAIPAGRIRLALRPRRTASRPISTRWAGCSGRRPAERCPRRVRKTLSQRPRSRDAPFARHWRRQRCAPRRRSPRWSWVALAILLGAGALAFFLRSGRTVPLGPAPA